MKSFKQQTLVSGVTGIAVLSFAVGADASDFATRVSNHREACAQMTVKLAKDLRLAMKVEEGEDVFIRYVRFRRPYEQWTTAEAINRAKAAALTSCGVAIGLKPIDEKSFPNLLVPDP